MAREAAGTGRAVAALPETAAPPAAGAALRAAEARVAGAGEASMLIAAEALLCISEQLLFVADGFRSFHSYLKANGGLGLGWRHAYGLAAAARVLRALPTDVPRPCNERQIRPLTACAPEAAAAAWRAALLAAHAAGVRQPTGSMVAACLRAHQGHDGGAGAPGPGLSGASYTGDERSSGGGGDGGALHGGGRRPAAPSSAAARRTSGSRRRR